MRRMILSVHLVLFLSIIMDCKEGDSSSVESAVFVLLVKSENCFSVPKNVLETDPTDPDPSNASFYTCSVAGLTYTCILDAINPPVVRTYFSVAAAKLGVMDAPSVSFYDTHAQRGLLRYFVDPSSLDDQLIYDTSGRLSSVSGANGSYTYSNYDSFGFPQSNDSGQTIAYTYDPGATIPNTVSDGGFSYTYDSKGWVTQMGVNVPGVSPSDITYPDGSLEICE